MSEEKEVPIKAYNKYQLCFLYNIGAKAFNEWLKPFDEDIGKQRGKKYTPDQVRKIFEHLGTP